MKRLFSAKPLLAAALVLGTLAATSTAHAGSDLFFSIGVQAPYGYVEPAPVYVQPQPVYLQRQPVYVEPQTFYAQPQPLYYGSHRSYGRRGPWGDADRDGVPNIYDRDSRFYEGRGYHRAGGWSDADRDGVPNRYDRDSRFYEGRGDHRAGGWGDADRDGVPNRYDRAPNNPHRR